MYHIYVINKCFLHAKLTRKLRFNIRAFKSLFCLPFLASFSIEIEQKCGICHTQNSFFARKEKCQGCKNICIIFIIRYNGVVDSYKLTY